VPPVTTDASPASIFQLPVEGLENHAGRLRNCSLAALCAQPGDRGQRMRRSAAGLRLDFSRQLLDSEALDALLVLAEQLQLKQRIEALFNGERANNTEDRPALHTLLRAEEAPGLEPLLAEVRAVQRDMAQWAGRAQRGELLGFSGEVITDVVNIGIGGSDLGPRLLSEALDTGKGPIRSHYVANVDPDDLRSTLATLAPQRTLFIVCSKSFRTEETLCNALAARAWLRGAGAAEADLSRHFLAVTTNLAAAADFGIPEAHCLPMWDWVGGRYSVWSAVGLSTAMTLGWEVFSEVLAGARDMDVHTRTAKPAHNLPLLLSLLEVWNCHFLGAQSHVVLPYAQRLRALPDFLQQLTMESNGKGVDRHGAVLPGHSAPVLWGSAGTIGQHSFHQLLHQGTRLCPADLIVALAPARLTGSGPITPAVLDAHTRLVANALAQSEAFTLGRSAGQAETSLRERGLDAAQAARLAPHLQMPGNRPHTLLCMESVAPRTLGALLALYEHRTFFSSVIWGINAFDQWGVELGKQIGARLLGVLNDEGEAQPDSLDGGTAELIAAWRAANRHAE
jgi:glucose-6-phosphate isomerase